MSEATVVQRDRSPGFPAVPLKEAVQRLEQFEAHFKRSPARPEKVGEAWGISTKSYADRIAAALRYFGFLDYQGQAPARFIVASEEGRKYLRAQQPEIKRQVLKAAALRPKQIALFWNHWGADRPADAACMDELTLTNGFSDSGAKDFLKVYDATIAFAELSESDKHPPVNDGEVTADAAQEEIEIGDLIQVEIEGAFALSKPDRVRAIQDHEGRRWVFIETSDTGVPMEQATLIEKAATEPKTNTKIAAPKLPIEKHQSPIAGRTESGSRREVFALDEGDVTLTFPEQMSSGSYEDLEAYLQIFLRKAKRLATLRDRYSNPEYLAMREAEIRRRAAQPLASEGAESLDYDPIND